MFAVRLEHGAALAVAPCGALGIAADMDRPRSRVEAGVGVEVLHLPDRPLQAWEEAGHRVRVVPDMDAGAAAAADAFPRPKPPVRPPLAGRRGQRGDRREEPVQEPVRQRGVVPRVVPQPCAAGEAIEMLRNVLGHSRRVSEAGGVIVADDLAAGPRGCPLFGEIGKTPRHQEDDLRLFAGPQRDRAAQGAGAPGTPGRRLSERLLPRVALGQPAVRQPRCFKSGEIVTSHGRQPRLAKDCFRGLAGGERLGGHHASTFAEHSQSHRAEVLLLDLLTRLCVAA